MRRVILVLVCSIGFAVAGASTAMAAGPHHGHGHHDDHGHHAGHGRGWYGHRAYRPVYRGVYGAPVVGVPVYPYGYPYAYPYAYPQTGFGIATNNFSLWFGQ